MYSEETIKEQIYNQMNGVYSPENIPEKVKNIVADEFEEGRPCALAYERVFQAKSRLNERLRSDEDHDIECIIDSMFEICRHLSMKMYDYAKDIE